MEIIDAQVHEPVPWEPWPAGNDSETRIVLSCELLLAAMDAAGVDAAVLTTVRPAVTEYACRTYPNRFVHFREYDPYASNVEELVADTREHSGALGIRIYPAFMPGGMDRFREGAYDRMLAAAEKHQIPVYTYVSGFLGDLVPVVMQHPDLLVIIDHIGLPQPPHGADTPPFRALPELLALARHPNVAVKLSGVPTLSGEAYPYRDLWPPIHQVIDAFGPQRVLWGSDIQRCRVQMALANEDGLKEYIALDLPGRHTYAQAVDYLRYSSELDDETKVAILGGTLRTLLRWPQGSPEPPVGQVRFPEQIMPGWYQ